MFLRCFLNETFIFRATANHFHLETSLSQGFLTKVNLKYESKYSLYSCWHLSIFQCFPRKLVLPVPSVCGDSSRLTLGFIAISIELPPVFGICININLCLWQIMLILIKNYGFKPFRSKLYCFMVFNAPLKMKNVIIVFAF